MSPGSPSVEMRIPGAVGRETRIRLGGITLVFVALGALAALAALLAAIALVPSTVALARERKAMDTALQRRAQLGERLRALVGSYEELERQVGRHVEFVDRIRMLYGLPDLPPLRLALPQRNGPTGIFAGALLHAERLHYTIEGSLSRTAAQLAVLERWEREHGDVVRSIPVVAPLPPSDAVPTTGFGPQRNPVTGEPEFHTGIDLAAPDGYPIRASAAGVVRWAGDPPANAEAGWWRLGRIVVVAHGQEYRTIYGHCGRILTRVGQRVVAGQTLAIVGRSGWTPTPRLHFEIRRLDAETGWQPVDPALLLLESALVPADLRRRAALYPELPPAIRLPRAFER